MSSYFTHMYVEDGDCEDILLRLEGVCENDIDFEAKVFCGFHKVKNLLLINIYADYDVHDSGLLKAEKIIEECVYDKFACITRFDDDVTVIKAWDKGSLVYDFYSQEKKQWIQEGYEDRFEIYDDPMFWDKDENGEEWHKNWDKMEKIFLEKYNEPEPNYLSYVLKKLFPVEMKILADTPFLERTGFNKMDWYLVFEKPGDEADSQACDERVVFDCDNLSEWYP